MKVLLFGATGMVGQGVLRACLEAPDVEGVTTVGRSAPAVRHPKLHDVVRKDLFDLGAIAAALHPFDACFFCLGVSSIGMDEATYSRLTYDLTIAIAGPLARLNPQMTFVYVSGTGTDSSEHGKSMWARVKGRTENALLRMPFKAVFLFRPGVMQPVAGTHSKVVLYNAIYAVIGPAMRLLETLRPGSLLTTKGIGIAMLEVARHGAARAVIEADDLKALVRRSAPHEA